MNRRAFVRNAGLLTAATKLPLAARPIVTGEATRRILYVAGHFSGHDAAALERTVENLGNSRFNVAILAFLHVRYRQGALQLLYNNTPVEKVHAHLPEYLSKLARGFPTQRKMMISIGGWGNRADFEAIRSAGVRKFVSELSETVIGPWGLDGIDLDLEPSTVPENTPEGWRAVHDEFGAMLVELSNTYHAVHPGHFVTHAPISSVAADLYIQDGKLRGVAGPLLHATRTATGNSIAWLNLQFYEGGDVVKGVEPSQTTIADYYAGKLLQPLAAQSAATGIAQPVRFLVPGFEPHYKQDLALCRETIAAIDARIARQTREQVSGTFLWEYGQIATTITSWGQGLQQALEETVMPR